MERDELIQRILAMPGAADVVLGLAKSMSADVVGVRYDADRESIVIVPHPDDLEEAFQKFGNAGN